MAVPRLVASVTACTVGLAFWWALTEPLPVPPPVLFALPVAVLAAAGAIAGRLGALAAPCALLFSLLLGSLIGTQLHHAFTPASAPVSSFGGIRIEAASLAVPLLMSAVIGAIGGVIGERALPSRRPDL
ncbi:MAG: hypothetical protein A3G84_06850 [Chloroflexi bacterium RIFCSPLOWO2_12_FULL_71_12]|nr:MAG: hypothetical protein A3G84_06850 [Chloroflexi bacterium RIFCSPLOWO2_12_FULL_71_12]